VIQASALTALKFGILDAVSYQLSLTPAEAPARAAVYPGAVVPWDDCECGLLAVHHASIYPSKSFPEVDRTGPFNGRCEPTWWVVDIRVTVARCVPETDTEDPPTVEAVNDAAIIADRDVEAMLAGVECALASHSRRVVAVAPGGPEGQCAAHELSVLVGFPNCPAVCP
jgi:hypothetical protein